MITQSVQHLSIIQTCPILLDRLDMVEIQVKQKPMKFLVPFRWLHTSRIDASLRHMLNPNGELKSKEDGYPLYYIVEASNKYLKYKTKMCAYCASNLYDCRDSDFLNFRAIDIQVNLDTRNLYCSDCGIELESVY